MKSRIIAFITAGALAATSLTAPAKAGPDEELLRIIAGAVVIGAIAHAANNNSKVVVTHGYHGHKHKVKKKKKKHHHHAHNKNKKPRQCLVRKWTKHGWKKRYDKNCMKHFGWHRHSGHGWHKHRRHVHR